MEKITYKKIGNYYIPNLYLPEQPNGNIGKYGHLRLNYLNNHNKAFYLSLRINGELKQHLIDIDKTAHNKVSMPIKQLAEAENINEKLKEYHQIEWIQAMNNIKNRAEEIVINEIINV